MLKIKNINQKTAVLTKENIAQSKIQILNYLIYNLWGSQDQDTVYSAFMSLYAYVYVSQIAEHWSRNCAKSMTHTIKKYLQHLHEWRIFLARIQKLWDKSGQVAAEIHSHTKDFRARGFIHMYK